MRRAADRARRRHRQRRGGSAARTVAALVVLPLAAVGLLSAQYAEVEHIEGGCCGCCGRGRGQGSGPGEGVAAGHEDVARLGGTPACADLALDGPRWRHPVRFVRVRSDLEATGLKTIDDR